MKKWILLTVLYATIIFIGLQNREFILNWIHESNPYLIPIMFFLSTFLSVFPIIPFTLFAGVMGAKYGIILGAFINWFGAVTAAIIFFFLSRYSLQKLFWEKVKHYDGIKKFQNMIEENAFIAVLLARLITIVPTIVVNIYSGLSRMSVRTYVTATAIGKIPSMFFLAFSGKQLIQSFEMFVLGITIYFLFILLIILFYRKWYSKKIMKK